MKNKNSLTSKKRRKWLENQLNLKLKNISFYSLDPQKIINRHCENMIGVAQIPLGIAGHIKIKRQNKKAKSYFLPLATTEGALIASVSRGCKATRLFGGIKVLSEEVGVTRGPVFKTKNIYEAYKLKNWLKKNWQNLQKTAVKTSSHLVLKKLTIRQVAKYVYVRFYFNTSEAMGMNMVTLATEEIRQLIEKKTQIKCLSLSGNFCIDKKPAWLNFINGRGKRVWAECVVKREVLKKVLKTTPEKIVETVNSKVLLGSIMAGSLGFNAHFSNIIAGLFLALGQDMAHVVEGSLGITTASIEKNNLYFSIYLPNLMLGTVGGGTCLETQKEALSILGFNQARPDSALRLAEIIGGAVLAGELSLLSALSAHHLAEAHQKLGREKK